VQHRHLPARGLLSLFSLLRAFPLTVIKRNQAEEASSRLSAPTVMQALEAAAPQAT
jgi:hypothetical protein